MSVRWKKLKCSRCAGYGLYEVFEGIADCEVCGGSGVGGFLTENDHIFDWPGGPARGSAERGLFGELDKEGVPDYEWERIS